MIQTSSYNQLIQLNQPKKEAKIAHPIEKIHSAHNKIYLET